MDCVNHPGVAAASNCAGCGQPFCGNCLVNIGGRYYCNACKSMAVAGAPMAEAATIPCKEANEALIYAIVGIFCFGIILEPIALIKALKAKKMIELNPRLAGSGKVTAAIVIACVGFVLSIIGIINIVSKFAHHP